MGPAWASTISTPAAPVGGNAGTTLGQQRLNAFQAAASIWGSTLTSSQTIVIRASFEPLACTATTAVLGGAGAFNIWMDFPGAAKAATWYPQALANKLSNSNLSAGDPNRPGYPRAIQFHGWGCSRTAFQVRRSIWVWTTTMARTST